MNFLINIKDKKLLRDSAIMLQPMLKLTTKMVTKSLLSYSNGDKEFAFWTIKKDNTIDELNKKLLKKSIKKSELPPEFQELLVSLSDIAGVISSIQRIGDHATNIAETSIYAIMGKDIRHKNIESEEL